MGKRLARWLFLFGMALTQGVVNVTLAGLWWAITGRGGEPDPDEPFSSRVGRNAIAGKCWALIAERMIDSIFGAGHCRASAIFEKAKAIAAVEAGHAQRICAPGQWVVWREGDFIVVKEGETITSEPFEVTP
jgi:hypothetical protein